MKNGIPNLKIEQLSSETQKLFDVLNKDDDLSVIIVGSSFIDTILRSILEKKFIKSSITNKMLDSKRGTLGTFMARADACYILGLIKKPLYEDLIKIAEVRNEVAHYRLALNFKSESVINLCGQFSYFKSLKSGTLGEPVGLEKYMVNARNQFVMTVVMISERLLLIGSGIIGAQ